MALQVNPLGQMTLGNATPTHSPPVFSSLYNLVRHYQTTKCDILSVMLMDIFADETDETTVKKSVGANQIEEEGEGQNFIDSEPPLVISVEGRYKNTFNEDPREYNVNQWKRKLVLMLL